MRRTRTLAAFTAAIGIAGCATPPPRGPSVMVLPGRSANFEDFQHDDADCREWAYGQIGTTPGRAARETAAEAAIVGAAVGAAAGAAIGAATGDAAAGAAIGAGSGLVLGGAVGGAEAMRMGTSVQSRFDVAYMQCMYAHGHQIPLPRGSAPYTSGPNPTPRYDAPGDIPPPPDGPPPPPPPGY